MPKQTAYKTNNNYCHCPAFYTHKPSHNLAPLTGVEPDVEFEVGAILPATRITNQPAKRGLINLVRPEGFKPPTPEVEFPCSIQLSYRRLINLVLGAGI
jgi:hypothetical protein